MKILEIPDPDKHIEDPKGVARFIRKVKESRNVYELDPEKIKERKNTTAIMLWVTNLDDDIKNILTINEQRSRITDYFRIPGTDFVSVSYCNQRRDRIITSFMMLYTTFNFRLT